jgi:hypothetical protein
MPYTNLANGTHPATLIYLVDISGSMKAPMQDGKTRMEVAKDAIQTTYSQMIQRSLRQGQIHSRYRVGMVAYTDDIYDVYADHGSIITIDKLKGEGVPPLTPQKWTNMAKAFRYAAHLLKEDIKKWSQEWLDNCPAPIIINITDCEYTEEGSEDPLPYVQKLKEISVPDGNVLVENIFITDLITLPTQNVKDWQGYHPNDTTGDPYGDKLLKMSSQIPNSYAQLMSEQAGLKIREGTAMMFPGISADFVKTGFVMSIVTGTQVKSSTMRPVYPEPKPQSE